MDSKSDYEQDVLELININYFKVLFEPVRIELIKYLSIHGLKSINEIAENFSQDRSVISRHLDLLYKQNILIKKKKSRYTFYEVNGWDLLKKFEEAAASLKELMENCEE